MRPFSLLLSALAFLAITSTASAAPIPNGDFESGTFGPWVLVDSGMITDGTVFIPDLPVAGGNYMGYITTGRNELPSDLHFTDLDDNGVAEREFSSLAISFVTGGPSTVAVDLNFLTSDIFEGIFIGDSDVLGITLGAVDDPSLYQSLWAVGDGTYTGNAMLLTGADFSDEFIEDDAFPIPTLADSSVYYGQTGFFHHEFVIGAGSHTLTFFVADSNTDGEATGMLIDNLTVTAVPEPGVPLSLALGAFLVAVALRQRA